MEKMTKREVMSLQAETREIMRLVRKMEDTTSLFENGAHTAHSVDTLILQVRNLADRLEVFTTWLTLE